MPKRPAARSEEDGPPDARSTRRPAATTRVRSHAPAAHARRVHRPDQAQGEPAGSSSRPRGGAASRSITSSSAGRPASARRRSRTSSRTRWASARTRPAARPSSTRARSRRCSPSSRRDDVLFIDEIHRLTPAVEESLYPAIEDFQIDIMTGDGPYATTIQLPLKPFTLVGATTRTGLLTAPLLSRFGYVVRLDYYPVEDLAKIVLRSARLLGRRPSTRRGAREIARALAGHAARRQPPAAPRARLRRGARARARSTARACARRRRAPRGRRRRPRRDGPAPPRR